MKKKIIFNLIILLILFGIVLSQSFSAEQKNIKDKKLSKITGTPIRTYLNINNISTVFKNDGISDIDVQEQNSGLVFPKGSRKTAVFQSGFLWGGKVAGEIRVGGSAYRTGLQPGKILSSGVAEDPNLDKNRIYRVRPDYKTGDMSSEVSDEGGNPASVRSQYEKDWNEWPATDGAPFEDKDGDSVYNPEKDIPGVPGADQTIWFVCNDLDPTLTQYLYGSSPIGFELQVTVWAYNQPGALGNMFFRKYLLINKGTNTVDSMFVSQWSDVDLGNSSDDYAGCDTTLSLGFCYNANASDATYNPLPPPAVGFDFFQGPIVPSPGDSAIFMGKRIYGMKNMPMTSYYYFARGDATVTDPTQGSYEGTEQFYNFFQGRIGKTGEMFTDPDDNETPFAMAGDPVRNTGWVDGEILPAGDRRIGMASGPFTMAPGDTQEVVVAEIAAGAIQGVNRLTAVSLLKYYDVIAQVTYDRFFQVTPPPLAPKVRIVELDKQIVLDWSYDTTAFRTTESYNLEGYRFQGYNVYQLPSASATIDQGVLVATFDIDDGIKTIMDKFFDPGFGDFVVAPVQYGQDVGIQRYVNITKDLLRGYIPLVNGIRYYYAVTAYAKTSLSIDATFAAGRAQTIENSLRIYTVVPHSINPEVNQRAGFVDTILADHISGISSAKVKTKIIDPTRMRGNEYRVDVVVTDSVRIFTGDDGDDTTVDSMTVANPKWTLTNITTNTIIYGPSTNFDMLADNPVDDGMQIGLVGAPFYTPKKEIGAQIYTPESNLNWVGVNWGGNWFSEEGVFEADGAGGLDLGYNFFGSSLLPYQVTKTIEVRFDAANGQKAYNFVRTTSSGGAPYAGFFQQPFTVYDVTNPSSPRQIDFAIMEQSGKTAQDNIWAPTTDYSDREYFFIIDEDYTATEKSEYVGAALRFTGNKPVLYAGWYTLKDGSLPAYQDGDVWRIEPTNVITSNDKWTFNTTHRVAITKSRDEAKKEVEKINVFPNPYYGVNTEELNKYQRFVTFNHLPEKATIRIFNLAGVLVRTIKKTTPGQFERWYLDNDNGFPVASGLYVIHIVMPDIDATKILKLSIIQERQVLDRF